MGRHMGRQYPGRCPACGRANPAMNPETPIQTTYMSRSFTGACPSAVVPLWRREGDSNPRYAMNVHTLSRRALSTTQTPLRGDSQRSSFGRRVSNGDSNGARYLYQALTGKQGAYVRVSRFGPNRHLQRQILHGSLAAPCMSARTTHFGRQAICPACRHAAQARVVYGYSRSISHCASLEEFLV